MEAKTLALARFLKETDGREFDAAYLCEAFNAGYDAESLSQTIHAKTEEGLTKSDLEGLHKDYIESRKATTLQRVSDEALLPVSRKEITKDAYNKYDLSKYGLFYKTEQEEFKKCASYMDYLEMPNDKWHVLMPINEWMQDRLTHTTEPIDFAQWICKQGFDSKQIMVSPRWGMIKSGRQYTTPELYDLYLKSLLSDKKEKEEKAVTRKIRSTEKLNKS